MAIGYDRPLYILPFNRRGMFQKNMFGWSGTLDDEQIQIERDDRWPPLRAGLSVTVAIAQGHGDAAWAEEAARAMEELETRYNTPETPEGPAPDEDSAGTAGAVKP